MLCMPLSLRLPIKTEVAKERHNEGQISFCMPLSRQRRVANERHKKDYFNFSMPPSRQRRVAKERHRKRTLSAAVLNSKRAMKPFAPCPYSYTMLSSTIVLDSPVE
mmetsp:Transcript_120272/g.340329  ORF Transcript_120272/g.340329 Transcript_120272/m.340329 type:complete len:106 (+) Transcript_120272:222-539(+)